MSPSVVSLPTPPTKTTAAAASTSIMPKPPKTTSTTGGGASVAGIISALTGKEGVCLIEATSVEWMWEQPWHSYKQSRMSGTGFVIRTDNDIDDDGDDSNADDPSSRYKIMTCSHVVEYAIDVRVRRHGSARKFLAKVFTYAPDVDLALLEIVDEHKDEFFFGPSTTTSTSSTTTNGGGEEGERTNDNDSSDTNRRRIRRDHANVGAVEFATDIPPLQSRVTVVGYPTGGSTICLTEGVVSRVDNIYFLNPPQGSLLALQIDAAINSGNSGGPCYGQNDGKVVGVAIAKSSSGKDDNVGYIVSSAVVQAFLGRVGTDGSYTLIPSVPYSWRKLENSSLRLAHKIPDDVHGVLLTDVCPSMSDYLKKDDVLMKIDDKSLADDGQISLRGDELIQHRYLLRGKRIDEETYFTVYRRRSRNNDDDNDNNGGGGKDDNDIMDDDGDDSKVTMTTGPCIMRNIPTIYPRWHDVDHVKDYLILGALVLLPLSYGIMNRSKVSTEVKYAYTRLGRKWPGQWEDKDGLVILTEILAHEISFSYSNATFCLVLSYNGTPVKSLRHLRDMWEATCEEERKIIAAEKEEEEAGKAAAATAEVTDVAKGSGSNGGDGDGDDDNNNNVAKKQKRSNNNKKPKQRFMRLELENADDIVFEVRAAMNAQADILKTHQIPKASVISDPNPKYKFG